MSARAGAARELPTWLVLLLSFIFYSLVSVIFSWPSALFQDEVFLTRQFDGLPTYWLIDQSTSLVPDLISRVSNYPVSEDLRRLDSFVLFALALVTRGLLSPARFMSLVVLIGPVLSAMAAMWCARKGLGVRFPWSLFAGLAYGFSGMMATAWLEGHIYYLLNPWLPLLLLALSRAIRPGAAPMDGVSAALYWVLCLLTSAYLGIFAALLCVALFAQGVTSRLERRPLLWCALAFILCSIPTGLLYVLLFAEGSGGAATAAGRAMEAGSARLVTLVAAVPDTDIIHHSIAAPLGFATLALLLFAPIVLYKRSRWRVLTLIALFSVLFSLGVTSQVGLRSSWRASAPLSGAEYSVLAPFLHFPIRFMWLYYLCGGMVAAQVLQELAERVGWKLALPLLGAALVDVLVVNGPELRIGGISISVPSAYKATPPGLPVLDLFSERPFQGPEYDPLMQKLTCFYQTVHRRPVMQRCIGARAASARRIVNRRLIGMLLEYANQKAEGEPADVSPIRNVLTGLGLGAVVVHVDLFSSENRPWILDGLTDALGAPEAVSRDGGETIVVFQVPLVEGAEPMRAYMALGAGKMVEGKK